MEVGAEFFVMSKAVFRVLAMALISLLPGCRSAVSKGKFDAQADLRAGKLVIEQYGLPSPLNGEAEKLLRTRYGIQTRYVAGCMVSKEITQHAEGYNGVMEAEIVRRFGTDVFDRTYQEARERLALTGETYKVFY
jgi:hypothetical protein